MIFHMKSIAEIHAPCVQCGAEVPLRTMPDGKLESVTGWRKRRFCSKACVGAYVRAHPEARRGAGRPKTGGAPRCQLGRPKLTERVERLERAVVGLMAGQEERKADDGVGSG